MKYKAKGILKTLWIDIKKMPSYADTFHYMNTYMLFFFQVNGINCFLIKGI